MDTSERHIRPVHLRSRLVGVMTLAATIFLVLLGGSASAVDGTPAATHRPSHSLRVAHVPPASARQGSDLELTLGVLSDCGFVFCSPVVVRVFYEDANGRRGMVREDLGVWPAVQTAVLTIPADAVIPPRISYRIRVYQDRCAPFSRRCSHAIASSPTDGTHVVSVRNR